MYMASETFQGEDQPVPVESTVEHGAEKSTIEKYLEKRKEQGIYDIEGYTLGERWPNKPDDDYLKKHNIKDYNSFEGIYTLPYIDRVLAHALVCLFQPKKKDQKTLKDDLEEFYGSKIPFSIPNPHSGRPPSFFRNIAEPNLDLFNQLRQDLLKAHNFSIEAVVKYVRNMVREYPPERKSLVSWAYNELEANYSNFTAGAEKYFAAIQKAEEDEAKKAKEQAEQAFAKERSRVISVLNPLSMKDKFDRYSIKSTYQSRPLSFMYDSWSKNTPLAEEGARQEYIGILKEIDKANKSGAYTEDLEIQTLLNIAIEAADISYTNWIQSERKYLAEVVANEDIYKSEKAPIAPLKKKYYLQSELDQGRLTYEQTKPFSQNNSAVGRFVSMITSAVTPVFTEKDRSILSGVENAVELIPNIEYGVLLGSFDVAMSPKEIAFSNGLEYSVKKRELKDKGLQRKICIINTRDSVQEAMLFGKDSKKLINASDFFDEIKFEEDVDTGVVAIVGCDYHKEGDDEYEQMVPSQHILGFAFDGSSKIVKKLPNLLHTRINSFIKESVFLFDGVENPMIDYSIAPKGQGQNHRLQSGEKNSLI